MAEEVLKTSWFTPASLFLVLNIIIGTIALSSRFTGRRHHQQQQVNPNHHDQQQQQQIVRVPSLLERVRSFNYFTSHHIYSSTEIATDSSGDSKPVTERGSEQEMIKVEEEEKVVVMKQSGNEKVTRLELGKKEEEARALNQNDGGGGGKVLRKTFSWRGDEEIDAKADDFINRFRQQLRLQRIDSLLRYKEMLTGGARKS